MLRLLFFAAVAYGIYLLIRKLSTSSGGQGFGGGPKLPCATCRHCRKLFDDGAMCGYGNRETFKNETHISNCIDYVKK